MQSHHIFKRFPEYPLRCHYKDKEVLSLQQIIPKPEPHNDLLLPVSPSQEDLEIPIFDWNVMWQVHNVARDTTNGFMLNDTWYKIDKTSSEKNLPLKDLMITKALMVQLKLSTENLRKFQAVDKQHSKIRE